MARSYRNLLRFARFHLASLRAPFIPRLESLGFSGSFIKSILTEKVYEVRIIKDWSAMLESLDGLSQVWTEIGNLELFYKKVECEVSPQELVRSPIIKQPLRSPSKLILDVL